MRPVRRQAARRPQVGFAPGPSPTRTDDPDPEYRTRPVGFTANLDVASDPLLWEGDDA